MTWEDRKEGLEALASKKEEWTTIRGLKKEFEEITNIRVSPQRVHQVINNLSGEDGPLETKKEKLGGNDVKYFRRKKGPDDLVQ